MLLRFNIKNVLSFFENNDGQSEEFSMIASNIENMEDRLDTSTFIPTLKFSAIYGANAAGKSNFIKALIMMRRIIIEGKVNSSFRNKYSKIKKENEKKSSYFEVEIAIHKKIYSYGFEVILNEMKFISEWLYEVLEGNKEEMIFTRDIENETYEFGKMIKSPDLKTKLEIYAGDVANNSNALFLSVMNDKKDRLYKEYEEIRCLRDVYMWFTRKLDISENRRNVISDYTYFMNKDNFQKVCDLIGAFGTGIKSFKIENISQEEFARHVPREVIEDIIEQIEKNKTKNNKTKNNFGITMRAPNAFFILKPNKKGNIQCKTLKFEHTTNDFLFDLAEESDGTIRVLDLLEVFMSEDDKTFVIDELDRCLHPILTYKFISLFFELAKIKNVQLVVTTHESRLLDFNLLRREEVWFVDKRESGASDIYPLSQYNDKFDCIIDKAYLEGRYGGVPIFNTIFPIEKV